LVMCSAEDSH